MTQAPHAFSRPLAIVGVDCAFYGIRGVHALASVLFETRQSVGPLTAPPGATAGQTHSDAWTETVVRGACRDAGCGPADRILLIVVGPEDATAPVEPSRDDLALRLGVASTQQIHEASLAHALLAAEVQLSARAADAVVLCAARLAGGDAAAPPPFSMAFDVGWQNYPKGDGAVAVVLRSGDHAAVRSGAYAIVSGATVDQAAAPGAPSFEIASLQVLRTAGVGAADIALVECAAAPRTVIPETVGLGRVFSGADPQCCALGAARATLGEAGGIELGGLLRVAVCLRERFIAGVPHFMAPGARTLKECPGFYVPEQSRPWLREPGARRRAMVSVALEDGHFGAVLLEEAAQSLEPRASLCSRPALLFPVSGDSVGELERDLRALRDGVMHPCNLQAFSEQRLTRLAMGARPSLTCVVVARAEEELKKELDAAEAGIKRAVNAGTVLKTPAGSYFTPRPFGRSAKVAFVYPGMGSALPGLGTGLLQQFPSLMARLENLDGIAPDAALEAKDLYPRSMQRLSEQDRRERFMSFQRDTQRSSRASMTFACLFTSLARDELQLSPDMAIGYSIGECSMFAALGIWPQLGLLQSRIARSPIFTERLCGPMRAAHEHWRLGAAEPVVWTSVLIKKSADEVALALARERHVYLLTINAHDEVMIGGDSVACARVIAGLNAQVIPVPFQFVIHCEPVRSEIARIEEMYTLPVDPDPRIEFYSAATCAPIPQTPSSIGAHIARSCAAPVDFPRLVRRAYADGARVFVEVGARASCSHWIERILQGDAHVAVPLSSSTVDDQTAWVRARAILMSHGIVGQRR